VTRAAEDAPVLAHALALAGFEPVLVPLLERQWSPLDVADLAARRPEADWVVITSSTAADVVASGAPNAWRQARWAAVGPTTADRLATLGYTAARVPSTATAADLIAAMGDLTGLVVVYPRADLAPASTGDGLRAAGAEVVDVVAYRNAAPPGFRQRLRAALPVHATTLLSGSAVDRVIEATTPDQRRMLGAVVVIGPSTARVAAQHGLPVDAVANPHTVAGVVAALRLALRTS
jgi:uroporphyrinogen-III synthase